MDEIHAISAQVNTMLTNEVDWLNQLYIRRSNLVFTNVSVPEKEIVFQVEDNVRKMIDEMGLPKVKEDVNKAHRLEKIK